MKKQRTPPTSIYFSKAMKTRMIQKAKSKGLDLSKYVKKLVVEDLDISA